MVTGLCFIDNLEVDLVALRSGAVNYGLVGCNTVLVILGLEGFNKYCVGFAMIGGQYVLITSDITYGEASSVVYVNLGDRFNPNVYFFYHMGRSGSGVSIYRALVEYLGLNLLEWTPF